MTYKIYLKIEKNYINVPTDCTNFFSHRQYSLFLYAKKTLKMRSLNDFIFNNNEKIPNKGQFSIFLQQLTLKIMYLNIEVLS